MTTEIDTLPVTSSPLSDEYPYPSEEKASMFFDTHNWEEKVDESQEWLFRDAIPEGSVSMIYGPGGVGKSTFTRVLALSVMTYRRLIPSFTPKYHNFRPADDEELARQWKVMTENDCVKDVILLSAEDDAGVVMRSMKAIAELYKIPKIHFDGAIREKLHLIAGRSERFLEPFGEGDWDWSDFFSEIYKTAKKLPGSPLIIIDPLQRFYLETETDNNHATRFMVACGKLAKNTLSTVILVHHPDKKTGQPRGATAFRNEVRSAWSMEATGRGSVKLVHNKCNVGPEQQPFELVLDGPALREKSLPSIEVGASVARWVTDHPDSALTMGGLKMGTGGAAKELLAHLKVSYPDLEKMDAYRSIEEALASGLLVEGSVKGRNGKTTKPLKVKGTPA